MNTTLKHESNIFLKRLGQSVLFVASLIVGLVIGLVLLGSGYWLFTSTAVGTQVQSLLGITAKTPWHLSRASGVVAYLLLSASTLWGLLLTTKFVKSSVPAPLTLAMHNILGWLAISLSIVHAVALLFDDYYVYTLANLLIPFTGPYRPAWVGLGIIGFFVMVITAASFSWRGFIGQVWWRRLHYFTYLAYTLVTVHGLMAGTDSGNLGMRAMFWGSTQLISGKTLYRVWTATASRQVAASAYELQ
ncbi:MAG: ferric reductase-like transmembrane domain-containing protein [Caldilineaceae bacterium]